MKNEDKINQFVQQNSSDGGFLQSLQWLKFQEKVDHKTHILGNDEFSANSIEHILPIVGKYFYCPRGPVFESHKSQVISHQIQELIGLAKKENAGWIRIEPVNENVLEIIKSNTEGKIVRAPHDMQPKEIFVMDISKPEAVLLSEMKSKTRYNINLAKKKGVRVISHQSSVINQENDASIDSFLKLTKEMAQRQGISTHGSEYYRKMIKSFPENIRIYTAEYNGEIIAANLVLFYGEYATYLHGASGNEHRNVMAPFLLQWKAILDAKESGCKFYDFGGVQTPGVNHQKHSDLVGVTNFKLGFSPNTKTIEFPGSYDIIISSRKYAVYKGLQKARYLLSKIRK